MFLIPATGMCAGIGIQFFDRMGCLLWIAGWRINFFQPATHNPQPTTHQY
jgi:hypothetical protein